MTTETTTTRQRRKRAKTRFIVTKTAPGGQPVDCGLLPASALGLGPELSFKAGLLVEKPNDPHVFLGERSAQRHLGKTVRTIRRLRESALEVDKMPRLQPLLSLGTFALRQFQQ